MKEEVRRLEERRDKTGLQWERGRSEEMERENKEMRGNVSLKI